MTLRCGHGGGGALLSVEDEGPGISEAERPYLFDKFRRGQTSAGSGPAGAGLGLFIVNMLTERIGGRIVYRPGDPRGSIFEVTLDGMRPSA
ncbi:sensor histidine kinase [Escherichia coli]|uniref:sensor histidine kinase n=1 Tax=Escherichia coli TaxID=562 RepID=UPI00338E41E0